MIRISIQRHVITFLSGFLSSYLALFVLAFVFFSKIMPNFALRVSRKKSLLR